MKIFERRELFLSKDNLENRKSPSTSIVRPVNNGDSSSNLNAPAKLNRQLINIVESSNYPNFVFAELEEENKQKRIRLFKSLIANPPDSIRVNKAESNLFGNI